MLKFIKKLKLRRVLKECLTLLSETKDERPFVINKINKSIEKYESEEIKKVLDSIYEKTDDVTNLYIFICLLGILAANRKINRILDVLIPEYCNTPQELCIFMDSYYMEGKRVFTNSLRRGLCRALDNIPIKSFDNLKRTKGLRSLSSNFSIIDIIRLAHPKPTDKEKRKLFNEIKNIK